MSYSYEHALSVIEEHVEPIGLQHVRLEQALGRVTADVVRAHLAEPSYDQSSRDGFALGSGGSLDGHERVYRIAGEIPAGRSDVLHVGTDQAYRIMTGALVPRGTVRVVLQEECRVSDRNVAVSAEALAREATFIQRTGSWIASGQPIVDAGISLLPTHLAVLAATGTRSVPVRLQPRVGIVCTGSELTDCHDSLGPGKKISSNRYLLSGLVRHLGATPVDYGIVADDEDALKLFFQQVAGRVEMIVSTGGVGPGKFDGCAAAFVAAGGHLVYRKLNMRPGSATLFGVINRTLYFGLPGPPTAVFLLFNELVATALDKMRGLGSYRPQGFTAHLSTALSRREADCLHLCEGMVSCARGAFFVRPIRRLEHADCCMVLQPGTLRHEKGDLVTVHRFRGLGQGFWPVDCSAPL